MSARTVEIVASLDDTNRFRNDVVYPPVLTPGGSQSGNTTLPTRKNFATPTYTTENVFLRFDTSLIPDTASVIAAFLRFWCIGASNTDTRNLNVEWYPAFASAGTVSDSDFAETVGTDANVTAVTVFTGTPKSFDLVLTNPATNINKEGFTGFRCGASGGVPTGDNQVFMSPWDHATEAAVSLYVEYTGGDFRPSYAQFPKSKLRGGGGVR